jgi:hypothetical protein
MHLSGWSLKISCFAVAALLSACGEVASNNGTDGGSGSGSNDGDFTLSVDPSTLTMPIAGSGTVTVNIVRTGSIGEVTLTADGLGTSLTADLATIAADATSAQVKINAVGGMAAGTSTVTITGTAGAKTHSDTVDVTTTTITVTGNLRDGRSGVKVGIIGKQTITTGSGGAFTFTDVTPPYDLYTFADGGCGNTNTPAVYWYEDLTRVDPTVNAATHAASCFGFFPVCVAMAGTSVTGTKTGAGNNTDAMVWAYGRGARVASAMHS